MVMPNPSDVNADVHADAAGGSAAVVDTHFHVFEAGVRAATPVRYVPAYDAPLVAWSEAAQAQGVAAGVVVQVSFLGTDNAQLLAALASAPDRLRGVAVLDSSLSDASLAALDAAGVRGVRWNLVGGDHRIDRAMQHFALRLAARDWHVEVHAEPGRLAMALDQVPDGVTVVVDHCGRPAGPQDTATWAAAARHADRLWVKLSGPYRQAAPGAAMRDADSPDPAPAMGALARRWRDALGPTRLLWGSDWPCTNHEAWQSRVFAHGWLIEALTAAEADAVLRTNPRALYRF